MKFQEILKVGAAVKASVGNGNRVLREEEDGTIMSWSS